VREEEKRGGKRRGREGR